MQEHASHRSSAPELPGGNGALWARPWVWYPALAGLLGALYLAGPLNHGPVFNALGASSAIAVLWGASRRRAGGHLAWEVIAVGQLVFVAGDALAYNYPALFGHDLPFPSIADAFYLGMYPCLVVGLLLLVRAGDPTRDRGALIDALVVTVGLGTLAWVFLMAPYAHDGTLTVLTKVTSLAYPVMDLLLLAMGARLVLAGTWRHPSAVLLGLALLALLGTDVVYGWALLHGGYETGGLLDGGWLAFYLLIGTAALHPSRTGLLTSAGHAGPQLTRRRLALLAATSLVAPGVQLVRSFLELPREPVISVASGVIFLLVLARLAGMVRLQELEAELRLRRRFEKRLAALVRHASDVVTLLDASARVTYVSPSGERLIGRSADAIIGRPWADLSHPEDVGVMGGLLAGLAPGESVGFDHRLRRADDGWIDVETLATNLLDDETVNAIVLNTRDVSQRKHLERRLEHQATHDALTGLPHRAVLEDHIERALARGRRSGGRIAVLFIDLDDFKILNDSLGHAAGDTALREVAVRLSCAIRASDSAARLGGDEFAVLVDGIKDAAEATAIATRCLVAIGEPLDVDGEKLHISAAIGIALDAADAASAHTLLTRADAAMYEAKRGGKSQCRVFEALDSPAVM